MRTLFLSSMELNSVHVWATVKLSFKSFLALSKKKTNKETAQILIYNTNFCLDVLRILWSTLANCEFWKHWLANSQRWFTPKAGLPRGARVKQNGFLQSKSYLSVKAVTLSKQNKKISVFSAVFEMTLESNHAISFVNAFLTGSQKCWLITLSIFSQLETRKVLVLAGETKRGISLLVCVTPSRFPRDWR